VRQQFVQIACSILASAALATPALAQSETAAVSGIVRDRHGAPQIDALVQLMRTDSSVVAVAHTDTRGVFLLQDLLPGVYQLKASEEAFLPSLRQNLRVLAHRTTVANVTLSTLFDAVQWLPAERRSANEPDDDWKWTLRSETNRPMLRFSDEGPVMVSEGNGPAQSRARVTTSGGLRNFGDGGLRHGMEYEGTGTNGAHTLLRTSLNATDGLQASYMAAYEDEIGPGRIMRTVAAYTDMPDLTSGPYGGGRYQAATLRTAETSELTPLLRAEIGNELLAMRLIGAEGGTEVVGRPFGSLILHGGGTTLAYRVSTSRTAQDASAMADDETLLPGVAQRAGNATLEHGLHQEVRLRHKSEHGASLQVAAFHDRMVNPLIQGSGYISDADSASGDLLIDPVSGVFRTAANAYAGYGFSAGTMVPLMRSVAITAELAAGPALKDPYVHSNTATEERSIEQTLVGLQSRLTPAITVAAEGNAQKTSTYWRASYRWQPQTTVTRVNPSAATAGDAYLSVLLRQPIRVGRILPGGTQAVIDMRNLLAQGYCPFVTPDGSTLFFAQADRSIAGGIAFTF
jgi:Carboxypeptidase regulatory-like domain